MTTGSVLERTATISPDGLYRYDLTRRWDDRALALWIMCNPSTADADLDDHTIRRCITLSKGQLCGGLAVVNLFAYRATDPAELRQVDDPVGPENDRYLRHWIPHPSVGLVIAAWGDAPPPAHFQTRPPVLAIAGHHGRTLRCFGLTKRGAPKHPSRLSDDVRLEVYA